MGLFDRLAARKTPPLAAEGADANVTDTPGPAAPGNGAVKPELIAAREKLELRDTAGAIELYERILGIAGDRADVLVTISGDLGAHGHVAEVVQLVAPRYDAERHGPATGLNLVQAYLALHQPEAAQHILDILFGLNRPELEERLHGFSNAVAEQLAAFHKGTEESPGTDGAPAVSKVGLVTISKPIWFYGLEPVADAILPSKGDRLRRVAFAQLAVPGYPEIENAINRPEDELCRLSRGLPLWLAETFSFSANYDSVAALAIITPSGMPTRLMIFGAEWSTENLRQLVESTQGRLDYIFAGALRASNGDYELVLRLYEVRGFRERKRFVARWTPGGADAELGTLNAELRRFMEWAPATGGIGYTPPIAPRTWVETLGASAGLFLAEKSILSADLLPPIDKDLAAAAGRAVDGESASLAFLTLCSRAAKQGVAAPESVALARSALVDQARQALGR